MEPILCLKIDKNIFSNISQVKTKNTMPTTTPTSPASPTSICPETPANKPGTPKLSLLPLPGTSRSPSSPKSVSIEHVNEYEILTPLKESQKDAREWIIHREKTAFGSSQVLGGFFCDPPGMGKTLSMIAAMQKNPGHAMAPTLIIVPPQVITVWLEEFLKRTTLSRDKIFIYYGPNRHKCEVSEDILFVISTYAVMRNECLRDSPKNSYGKSWDKDSRTPDVEPDSFIQNSIFNFEFYRVILDEAHIAKNHKTKVSIALTWLIGRAHV